MKQIKNLTNIKQFKELDFYKDYENLDILKNLEDMAYSFIFEYNEGYICDIISYIADNCVPIYYSEIWEQAKEVSEYVKEAFNEFGYNENEDLEINMQKGIYYYNEYSLYQNLDILIYNYAVNYLDEAIEYIEDEETKERAKRVTAEELKELLSNIDNNNTYEDINQIIEEYIENEE